MPGTGEQFGGYRLHEILGRGGMGVVYRAEHVHLGRTVALKVLAPELSTNADFRGRFLRESRLAAALDHPNVVTVYDAGDVDGSLYLAMRMVQGKDLAGVLKDRGALPPDEAIDMLGQVADALDAAHAAGLVHRDVKPGNVLVQGERCFLTDFGLTKQTHADMTAITATGVFLGTPDYAAPEQISAMELDSRADVYALGAVLYECLTGARPFARPSQVAVLYAHLHEPPPRPCDARPHLPSTLDAVIARALAKAPDARYPSCGELIAATREAMTGAAEAGPAPTALAAPPAATALGEPSPTGPVPAPGSTAPGQPPTPTVGAAMDASRSTANLGPATGATRAAAPAGGRRGGGRVSRPALFGLAAALVALVAVVAVFALSGGDDGPSGSTGPGGSGATDRVRSARAVGDPISLGTRPFGVATAGGSLWAANNSDDTVTRTATDGSDKRTVEVGSKPFGLTATDDAVWVVHTGSDSVVRIDAGSGRKSAPVPVGDEPYFAATDGRSVYVSSGRGSVSVVDATSQQVTDTIDVGGELRGIAVTDEGAVWVADKESRTAKRIREGRVDLTVDVGRSPVGVAFGGDAVWVANKESGTVSRVDAENGDVQTIEVGSEPYGIAFGEGYAWVTDVVDDTLSRLDPETGEPSGRRVRVRGQPVGVAVADGSVWVTANDAGTLTEVDPGT